jgi:hypothetical protein
MPETTSDKLKQTQGSFAPIPPGAVAECPLKSPESTAESAAVEVKQSFEMTQRVLQTIGARQPAEKKKEKKAWIEIILVDLEGKPVPGVKYRITPPGGQPVEGRLNEHGQAGLYMIEPGNCKITFPDLDKDAWE